MTDKASERSKVDCIENVMYVRRCADEEVLAVIRKVQRSEDGFGRRRRYIFQSNIDKTLVNEWVLINVLAYSFDKPSSKNSPHLQFLWRTS